MICYNFWILLRTPPVEKVVESTPPPTRYPNCPPAFPFEAPPSVVVPPWSWRKRCPGPSWCVILGVKSSSGALNFYMYFHVASFRMRKMLRRRIQHTKNMLFISRFILKYNHNKIQPRPPTLRSYQSH